MLDTVLARQASRFANAPAVVDKLARCTEVLLMASTAYQHRCVVVLPHDHDDDYTKVLEPAVKAGGMMAERATAATSQRDKNVYASRSAMPMPF